MKTAVVLAAGSLVAGGALLCCPFVFAQAEAPVVLPAPPREGSPASAAVAPRPITDLAGALDAASWDPARRGPLLVIAPKTVRAATPKRDPSDNVQLLTPPPPLGPVPAGGYRVDQIDTHFGRKLIRLGTLSVLAPTEMVVLNARPGKANPLGSLRRDQKLRLFQASLTAAQWKTLGSERGLGMGDLSNEQRALWDGLVPDPFRVRKAKATAGGYSYSFSSRDPNSTITLPAGQRAGIRLRLNRSTSMNIPTAQPTSQYSSYGTSVASRPSGTEILTLVSSSEWQRPDAYGVMLRQELPNRLKPGDISFDSPALHAPVSLDGVKTVGDLVKRVGAAARAELMADNRVAALPVWVRAAPNETAARAGDVLKALCLAVTGTFRKVSAGKETVYVLSDDVEGVGARRARIAEWFQDAASEEQQLTQKLDAQIRAQQPLQHLSFASDDPTALDGATMSRIEAKWNTAEGRYLGETLRVSELPSTQRALVADAITSYNERPGSESSRRPLRGDVVNVSVRTKLAFLIPGLGTVEDTNVGFNALSSMLPPPSRSSNPDRPVPSTDPVVLPPGMAAGATLLVTPRTEQEALEATRLAGLRGLKQLWVEVLPGEDGKKVLAAAIVAGKERGLAVYAVASLLQTAGETPEADLNILGETGKAWVMRRIASPSAELFPGQKQSYERMGDWLRPDDPAVLPLIKKRLLDLAATPGLGGLVLKDTGAPGYVTPGAAPGDYFSGGGSDFGYTPAARLAFLRAEGYDPLDLGTQAYFGGAELNLPFFPTPRQSYKEVDGEWVPDRTGVTPLGKWNAFRYRKNVDLLIAVHAALRAAHPELALLIRERSSNSSIFGGGWYGSWDKNDALPNLTYNFGPGGGTPQTRVQIARSASKRVLISVGYQPGYPDPLTLTYDPAAAGVKPDSAQAFARYVSDYLLSEKGAWDGIVFDLSAVPFARLPPLLDGLAAPPSTRALLRTP